eukprot:PLAT2442.1.p1 GENE.PLAT2442.1~~PLAT2442.1.p1  ORF type:complete len:285 (+),score=106.77 PLAT2442.1:20-874(+)
MLRAGGGRMLSLSVLRHAAAAARSRSLHSSVPLLRRRRSQRAGLPFFNRASIDEPFTKGDALVLAGTAAWLVTLWNYPLMTITATGSVLALKAWRRMQDVSSQPPAAAVLRDALGSPAAGFLAGLAMKKAMGMMSRRFQQVQAVQRATVAALRSHPELRRLQLVHESSPLGSSSMRQVNEEMEMSFPVMSELSGQPAGQATARVRMGRSNEPTFVSVSMTLPDGRVVRMRGEDAQACYGDGDASDSDDDSDDEGGFAGRWRQQAQHATVNGRRRKVVDADSWEL